MRFGPVPATLRTRVEALEDLPRLHILFQQALLAASLDEWRAAVDE